MTMNGPVLHFTDKTGTRVRLAANELNAPLGSTAICPVVALIHLDLLIEVDWFSPPTLGVASHGEPQSFSVTIFETLG